eukprot:TRINITY_DN37070_c0_g1_i1.p1 TRINITY_DN37070_c0_g1~~TRINITY_DN37070_c0_g1_i1.p1  ORF type:complete len:244 (+),score=59.68 TRINITY_DN37070_c0_g1_i1:47-778(+)
MSKVFIEITAGDDAENQKIAAQWKKISDFVSKKGIEYGLSSANAAELTEDDKGILRDLVEGDPALMGDAKTALVEPPANPILGKLVIDLNDSKCPKTSANFRALCTGEKGKGKESGKPLHYLNSVIHRLVPGVLFQGGDFVKGTGAAGESIYGLKFKDEKEGLKIKHSGLGDVGMANGGKDSNSSQFYISLCDDPLTKLDGKHVVFGKVVQGLDVLPKIASFAGDKDGFPRVPLRITSCGIEK